jgi:formate dehydrogenase maturation protein FdhE
MTDRRRTTGVFTHFDDTGKEFHVVNFAAGVKTVVASIVAVIGLVVMLASWFNGHVQAQAIKALGHELTTDGTDIQNAFKALLDERAEEIEAHVLGHLEAADKEAAERERRIRKTVWKATSPARRAEDSEPTDAELDE